jgi:hypothetical protein
VGAGKEGQEGCGADVGEVVEKEGLRSQKLLVGTIETNSLLVKLVTRKTGCIIRVED